MERKMIIGIMGPGESAAESDLEVAFQLGKKLAEENFLVLTGGRSQGVMDAAMKGAKSAGGTTIGILPSADGNDQSKFVDIPIKTGMGSARNNINVLTSDLVVAVGMGAGTASEVTLAIKANKPVILMNASPETMPFLEQFAHPELVKANTIEEALQNINRFLSDS
ncbi:TIGR00725 family protein [Gracilimonas tropica]|uniref:TIGR00725 family protein n=1 Tax=Gracilimonas tropica TaxID=454600 RepID=UPI00047640FE|nr:TIGR00725 family protein [Gracilimonas tropica]